MTPPRFYRTWFYAAAAYNLVWGIVVLAVPGVLIERLAIQGQISVPFLQVIGMIVGVYAYGYYLLAREPLRYSGLIWIGLAGKTFGPLGFLFYASRGDLPWSFGATILTNDIIWWPVFWSFALKYGRKPLE